MIYYTLGEVIKESRIRNKMTQREVARGICSSATIARIEQGKQMPSRRVLEELFRRLGEPVWFFAGMTLDARRGSSDNLAELLQTNLPREKEETPYEKQFRDYITILKGMDEADSVETVLEELLELLEQSCPLERLREGEEIVAFTYLELWVINSIAKAYFELEECETAEEFLMKIIVYVERNKIDHKIRSRILPLVFHNLAALYARMDRLGRAEEYCEAGIQCCINEGKLWLLDELFGLYALVLQKEGIAMQAEYANEQGLFLRQLKKRSDTFKLQKRAEKIMLFSCF